MYPRAIVFDLDGTLAKSKTEVGKDVGELLKELLTYVPVAVMSGGSWKQFETQLLPALPADTDLSKLYLFPVSAGECRTYQDGAWKVLYTHAFSKEEHEQILHALTRALKKTGLSSPPKKVWGERIEDRGAQITFSALGQKAPIEEKKRWDPDKKKRMPLVEELKRELPHLSIRANATTSVDITKEGITKAFGLKELARITQIPVHHMLYVGDALFPGGNDAVVYEACTKLCVATKEVRGPEETKQVIRSVLEEVAPHSRIYKKLKRLFKGEVTDAKAVRDTYKKDTSVFERMPQVVAFPKNTQEVSELVKATRSLKQLHEPVSVTARAAGTDMSGGPLTYSLLAVFTKYMNKIHEIKDTRAVVEPGVYYRDFEKEAQKKDLLFPSYPASKNIAALGGIVANDSGGERTLQYGKTRDYVEALEVVLSDGSVTTFAPLSKEELEEKKALTTFEGEIYRKMSALIFNNQALIEKARPKVSKNSAGYALWEVYDSKNDTFDLSKLIVGSQGTLAFITKIRLRLVRPKPHRAMLVVFLSDLKILPEIVKRVLLKKPESFESYDDHTFSLAVRFLPQLLSQMGLVRALRLGFSFLPEVGLVMAGGVPKLVLMAEFAEETHEKALQKAQDAQTSLADLTLRTRIAKNEKASEKYWIVRRESFALLRKNLSGLYASPFIDDFVVPPESYPEFLPRLNALLGKYHLLYTIAGHIGNGNFHIIPLMNLSSKEAQQTILELAPKVYDLVIEYGGTTTGEHNDGIIRTPYLPQLFGEEIVSLFEETKRIFDPLNIFNPGKKVGGTFKDIEEGVEHHTT